MLVLPQVDHALLRNNEKRKDLEWRLSGSAVSNLSKTSGMHMKSFLNIYYIHLYICFHFFGGLSLFRF
jgi:hypothetical protein